MSRSALLAPFLLAATLLDPARVAGQAMPRTEVFEVAPPVAPWILDEHYRVDYDHRVPGALAVPGGFAVYWSTNYTSNKQDFGNDSITGRFLDRDGQPGHFFEPTLDLDSNAWYSAYSPVLARSTATGNLLFVWGQGRYGGSYVWHELLDPIGLSLSSEARVLGEDWAEVERDEAPAVAGGREIFVVAWNVSLPGRTIPTVQVFGAADGEALTPPIPVDLVDGFTPGGPEVGVDAKDRFLVIWAEPVSTGATFHDYVVRGQRFTRDGEPLGGGFDVASGAEDTPALVMGPDGSFTVAWKDRLQQIVQIRQFHPDGTPAGPPVKVPGLLLPPALARDPHGNLALAWDPGVVQLFNRHLVPQGPPLQLAPLPGVPPEGSPNAGVAFDNSGRLLTVWTGPLAPGALSSILGRIWDVRRDADACAYRGKRFLCDTAGDGGAADVVIPFGLGRKVHTPLLGDFDGDGLDDPCVYGNGRFLCDTSHDGGLAERRSPRFGRSGDVPLLGDLDGDGRDDPCLYRAGRFLCDVNRNGKADRSIALGLPGDLPVIGDVDGDRRDDPCVVRGDRFLCNTGSGPMELILGAVGTPALGDVNGDGRDDPCVFTSGRLVCGLFPEDGGIPTSVVDRAFGKPGDVFLLGDLDAF